MSRGAKQLASSALSATNFTAPGPTMAIQMNRKKAVASETRPISYAEHALRQAADTIQQRAASRDLPQGERSMARAVAAFNGLVGGDRRLTEHEGWLLMVCLKMARATAGAFNPDDYVDMAAYGALAGECQANTPQASPGA